MALQNILWENGTDWNVKKKKKLTNICVSVLKTSFEIYDHNMLYDSVGK